MTDELSEKELVANCDRFGFSVVAKFATVQKEGELQKDVVSAIFALTTQQGAIKGKTQTQLWN